MKKRNLDNKGFTLVELIVVLVILAILAAILVPALLGYIDQAKSKQSMINARTVLTAAQAELSSIYGSKAEPEAIQVGGNHNANFKKTADFDNLTPSVNKVTIACKKDFEKGASAKPRNEQHDAFTVVYMEYIDESVTLYYDGTTGEWFEGADSKPTIANKGSEFVVYGGN
ncbi:MAG: type II secretion system protein [Lachnospiraceae bacterium]|nr:type II secretion system protein [Lachnospiraceae bacterium]